MRLLVIDELHLLHQERGAALESIVSRVVFDEQRSQDKVRVVGLSATFPNYEDVAAFLRVIPGQGLYYFGNSFRPCPLSQQFYGVVSRRPVQRSYLTSEICYWKVVQRLGKHQALVFVHSRREAYVTAKFLRDTAAVRGRLSDFNLERSEIHDVLIRHLPEIRSVQLGEILTYGVAFHHGGLSRVDRGIVEDLFGEGYIQVLVSTATLA